MTASEKRDGRHYSHWGRPFRRQLSPQAQDGFPRDAPASSGRCRYEGCSRFEWRNGATYCRDHWLLVYHQSSLPDRW